MYLMYSDDLIFIFQFSLIISYQKLGYETELECINIYNTQYGFVNKDIGQYLSFLIEGERNRTYIYMY